MVHLIIILLIYINRINCKIIRLKLYDNELHSIHIQHYHYSYVGITLQETGNFLYSSRQLNDFYEEYEDTYKGKKLLIQKSFTFFEFDKHSKIPLLFNFIYSEQCGYKADGISLALNYTNTSSSFLNKLKQSNLIDKSIVGFAFDNNREGTLYIGGIDKEIIDNKKSFECQSSHNYWGCDIRDIIMDKEVYHNRYKVYFEMNHQYRNRYIVVPIDFFEYLKSKFEKEFSVGYCVVDKVFNNFNCQTKALLLKNLPSNLKIVFDNNKMISIPFEKLLKRNNFDSYSLLIYPSSSLGKNIEDKFVFGETLLSLFDTVLDYDKRTVTFYSNYFIEEGNFNSNLNVLYIISEIVILLIGIMTIFLYYIVNNTFIVLNNK